MFAYKDDFADLQDTYDHFSPDRTPLKGKVQFLCVDPPFNVRRERNLQNSDYDVLTEVDMKAIVQQAADLVRPGVHLLQH